MMFNQKTKYTHEVTQATSLLNTYETSLIVEATVGSPVDVVMATTSQVQ